MSKVAERIAIARNSRGWSQTDLAAKMGVARSTVAMWEKGQRRPDIDTLEALADVFNCTLAYLIEPEEDHSDAELLELRESLRRNPDTKVLYQLTRNAPDADIKAAIAVLKSLKAARCE